jgi:hypothetical protein
MCFPLSIFFFLRFSLILSLFTLTLGGRTWSLDLLSDFVTYHFDFRRAMRNFIGLASTKSDDELLSLSHDRPLFKGLDGVFGPLRCGLKDRARLKEREAKAELLARNGDYGEADIIEKECSKVCDGLWFGVNASRIRQGPKCALAGEGKKNIRITQKHNPCSNYASISRNS